MNLEPLMALLHELAAVSGDLDSPYFAQADLGVELKSDDSRSRRGSRRGEGRGT